MSKKSTDAKVKDEQEVLDWIDDKTPLPTMKGTQNCIYAKHMKAICRLIKNGILMRDERGTLIRNNTP